MKKKCINKNIKSPGVNDLMPKRTLSFEFVRFIIDFMVCYFMAVLLILPLFNVFYLRAMMQVKQEKSFRKLQKK